MTNAELIKKLQELPPDMEVMLTQSNDESVYGMVEEVSIMPIRFEAPHVPKKEWPTIDCIVIADL